MEVEELKKVCFIPNNLNLNSLSKSDKKPHILFIEGDHSQSDHSSKLNPICAKVIGNLDEVHAVDLTKLEKSEWIENSLPRGSTERVLFKGVPISLQAQIESVCLKFGIPYRDLNGYNQLSPERLIKLGSERIEKFILANSNANLESVRERIKYSSQNR